MAHRTFVGWVRLLMVAFAVAWAAFTARVVILGPSPDMVVSAYKDNYRFKLMYDWVQKAGKAADEWPPDEEETKKLRFEVNKTLDALVAQWAPAYVRRHWTRTAFIASVFALLWWFTWYVSPTRPMRRMKVTPPPPAAAPPPPPPAPEPPREDPLGIRK